MQHNIIAIDATWLSRRNFHALNKCKENIIPATETEPEKYTQNQNLLIISFLQSVLKRIKDTNYERKVYCLWDRGTYRYRDKKRFVEYKENRVYDDSYQTCWDATNFLVPYLRKLGINSIQISGLEADDLGMYYSHNSKECELWSSDSDWHQSITRTTVQNTGKKIVTYDDIVKDHITEPFDLAIHKAIIGGHDDLIKVNLDPTVDDLFDSGDLMGKTIRAFKENKLPEEIYHAIAHNMQLSRLDRILTDEEVHKMIKEQEELTEYKSTITLFPEFHKVPNIPAYFSGVLGKYNRLWNK